MLEVTFWRDGVEKTIADKFDNMQDALEYAREGVEYREQGKYWYDEALILDTEDYTMTEITRTGVSGTFQYQADSMPSPPFFFEKNYGDFVDFSWTNRGKTMEILCAERYCGEPIEKMQKFHGDFVCI